MSRLVILISQYINSTVNINKKVFDASFYFKGIRNSTSENSDA